MCLRGDDGTEEAEVTAYSKTHTVLTGTEWDS
jgi:hypothetical protein